MTTGIVTPRRASSYRSESLFIKFPEPACKGIKPLVCALKISIAPAESEGLVQSYLDFFKYLNGTRDFAQKSQDCVLGVSSRCGRLEANGGYVRRSLSEML